MAAKEKLRRRVHRRGIERWADMPGAAVLQGERRPPVDDAVAVEPPLGGAPRIEIVAHPLDRDDRNGRRLYVMIERALDLIGRRRARQIEMRRLAERVDAGIGAPGAVNAHHRAAELLDRALENLLHGKAIRLALPADEPGPVIFEGQLVAGHGRSVPRETAWPRRKEAV